MFFTKPDAPRSHFAAVRGEAVAPVIADVGANAPDAATAQTVTRFGRLLSFVGNVSGDGDLVVEGNLLGDVSVSRLVILGGGKVEGNVRARALEVQGQLVGNAEAESVHISETAEVDGDISHGRLTIEPGAYFQGRCQQLRPKA